MPGEWMAVGMSPKRAKWLLRVLTGFDMYAAQARDGAVVLQEV